VAKKIKEWNILDATDQDGKSSICLARAIVVWLTELVATSLYSIVGTQNDRANRAGIEKFVFSVAY